MSTLKEIHLPAVPRKGRLERSRLSMVITAVAVTAYGVSLLLEYEGFRTVTFSVAVIAVIILGFKLFSDTDAEEDELIAVMNAVLEDYGHALLDSDVFLPKAPGDTVTIPLGRKRKVEISRLEDGSLKLVGDAPPVYDDDDRQK